MGYWTVALGLVAFGFVTGFSIGAPFLLIGMALLALGPVRRRPAFFWPPLAAVIAGNAAYWAVVPAYCTATSEVTQAGAVAGSTTTICSSLLGIPYAGAGIDNPPNGPAAAAGVAAAIVAFLVMLATILVRARQARRVRPAGTWLDSPDPRRLR